MSPIGSCVWTLDTRMGVLFWKVVEPLGGGTSLEEVGHYRQGLRFYRRPHFLSSLFPVLPRSEEVRSPSYTLLLLWWLLPRAFPSVMDHTLKLRARTNPSSFKWLLVKYLVTVIRKVTNKLFHRRINSTNSRGLQFNAFERNWWVASESF